tara:strand:- start:24 stop:539 length:516 start_codon:yes stop_codon:yes gene_type:complete
MKITFGKYKNQELSKVYEDANYKNWLLNQSFFKKQYHDEYKYLLNYKPISPINFDDLPGDIKSLIYGINYNAEKSAYEKELEEEKKNGIFRHGKKGKMKVVKRGNETHTRYINCKECGRHLNRNGGGFYDETGYECCSSCYDKFKRQARERREQQRQLRTNFCLLDSDDED